MDLAAMKPILITEDEIRRYCAELGERTYVRTMLALASGGRMALTEDEIRRYCAEFGEQIYVRTMLAGRGATVKLSDLDPEAREQWIVDWLNRSEVPIRSRRSVVVENHLGKTP